MNVITWVILGLAAVALLYSLVALIIACFTGLTETVRDPVREDPVSSYHRHYVVPDQDLDQQARSVWSRATSARDKIHQSEVVAQRIIDSVQISVVLPYHLWDIALALASLSELRAQHTQILSGIDAKHPDVAAKHPDVADVLDPQRRVQAHGTERVEQTLRSLEAFADLVDEADAARRREKAVRQLAELNDAHADMFAREDHDSSDLDMGGHMSRDIQAVIEQTNEAIRRANEAGRSLVLPEERTT
jgi:hypothetical protein